MSFNLERNSRSFITWYLACRSRGRQKEDAKSELELRQTDKISAGDNLQV